MVYSNVNFNFIEYFTNRYVYLKFQVYASKLNVMEEGSCKTSVEPAVNAADIVLQSSPFVMQPSAFQGYDHHVVREISTKFRRSALSIQKTVTLTYTAETTEVSIYIMLVILTQLSFISEEETLFILKLYPW